MSNLAKVLDKMMDIIDDNTKSIRNLRTEIAALKKEVEELKNGQ